MTAALEKTRMRRLPALLAALALTSFAAAPALAQTPAAAAPAKGVTVAEVKTWLTGLGGTVAEPQTVGAAQVLRVADQPLPWSISFFACTTLCDDVQYTAVFTGPITEAQVSDWNRNSRYLKAVYIPAQTPGGDATILAQYDVLLTANGVEQLQEPTYAWLQLLRAFAQTLTGQTAAAAAPAQ